MGMGKPLKELKHQAGFLMVGMSIALLAASLVTIGAARISLNTWKENIGSGLGNQLQTINDALAVYISANSVNLIDNKQIAMPETVGGNVNNKYSPTIAELKSLGYLTTAAQATPTAGTAYKINIAQPSGCATGCVITGYVYLEDPIRGPDGKESDIRLLGAAVNASKSNQIGFSLAATPADIRGNGWSMANPDTNKRSGILYARTNVTYTPTVTSSTSSKAQYWLSPAKDALSFPLSGNTLGDGRYVIDTRKPYTFNSSNSWVEAFAYEPYSVSMGLSSGKGGTNNVFIGNEAGKANAGGATYNLFLGNLSGQVNETGTDNVFAGNATGSANKNGSNNVFVGSNAGKNNLKSDNVFVGKEAGLTNQSGEQNIFTGTRAGRLNKSGSSNVFIGHESGINNTHSNNVFVGNGAGGGNTSGENNVFTGINAGIQNTTGKNNVFTGYEAGNWNQSGNNNTVYGHSAGLSGSNQSNSSAFGSGAIATTSNSVRIGNTSVTSIGGQAAWSNASDSRLKTEIQDASRGLDFVLKLRPVDYLLKESKLHQTGFIAQEVEAIDANFPGVHKPANDKDFYSLTYTDFIPSIVKSIQQLEARTASATPTNDRFYPQLMALMWALLALLTALVVWLFCQNLVMRRKLDLLQFTVLECSAGHAKGEPIAKSH